MGCTERGQEKNRTDKCEFWTAFNSVKMFERQRLDISRFEGETNKDASGWKERWSETGEGRKKARDFAGSSKEWMFRVMCNGIQTANWLWSRNTNPLSELHISAVDRASPQDYNPAPTRIFPGLPHQYDPPTPPPPQPLPEPLNIGTSCLPRFVLLWM